MKIPTYRDVIVEARGYRSAADVEQLRRAEEILRQGLKDHPYALPIADELTHVLELQDRDDEALAMLKDMKRRFGGGSGGEETLCRFGKLYKKRAARLRGGNPARALSSLEEAEKSYRQAYETSHAFYPRINQLTTRFLRASLLAAIGRKPEAEALLREVRLDADLMFGDTVLWEERLDDDNIWLPATQGEAHFLVGNWHHAETAYAEAKRAADEREYYLSCMCEQIELLGEGYLALGIIVGSPFDDPRSFFGLPPEKK